MSVYTKMAQEECLKTIRKYDNDELIKFITKHGHVEFCNILKSREITGEKFLSLKEFEVLRWKLTIPERRKLWSFIIQVQENPEKFFPTKKPQLREPNMVKKTNTQHQNTKEKLELVIGVKTPEQNTLKKLEVSTLTRGVKKPLPEPPPSPPAQDYLVMEKPLPPPPIENFYDPNGYLLPVQRTPEVEEANYSDSPPLLPIRTPISERKPLALPRDIPPESPKLFPRIVNKPATPSLEKKIIKRQVLPPEEDETYETAPNVQETVFKNQESDEEDDTYEPVPNSPNSKKEETSTTSFTKIIKIFKNTFTKKTETMTKKSSKEENDFRPLPPVPTVPTILTPRHDKDNNFYENTEDVKNGERSPSPNVIYTNTGIEVVSSGGFKKEKVKPKRRKSEGKDISFQRNTLLSASLHTLPGTSPPKKIIEDKFSVPRSRPIPIRPPSPEIIYTNEAIQESLENNSRRIPNSNLPPTPDEKLPRVDSSEAIYTNTATEEIQTNKNPVVQRTNTPPISKTEETTSSLSRNLKPPPSSYEHYLVNSMKPLPKPPNTPPQLLLDPKEILSEICRSDTEEEYQQFTFNINNEPFYRQTDRKGAKLLLNDLEDGAFLFRPSKKFYLTLSVKKDGKYYNLGIDKTENNKIRLNTANDDLSPEFATLDELASYFTREELRFTSEGNVIKMFLKKILPSDVF